MSETTTTPEHTIQRAFAHRDPDAIHGIPVDSYLMHVHCQRCAHCGRRERWSVLYEVRLVPAPILGNNGLRRLLRPVTSALDPMLELGYSNLNEKTVLRCGHCIPFEPSAPPRSPLSEAEWAKTLERKYAPPPSSSPRPSTPRSTSAANIEDL